MTAVEWLIENILKHDKSFVEFYNAEIEQAIELEKQQIIDAYKKGYMFGMQNRNPKSEEYYNETYKPST
jgi:hypothetical protein